MYVGLICQHQLYVSMYHGKGGKHFLNNQMQESVRAFKPTSTSKKNENMPGHDWGNMSQS